jgi:hypothetical protein
LGAGCGPEGSIEYEDEAPLGEIEGKEDTAREVNAFIRRLASAAGEYFDYEGTAYRNNIRPVEWSRVSPGWMAVFQAKLAEIDAPRPGSARLDDFAYRIYRSGRVVGYVLSIVLEDGSLDDGHGTRIYYNRWKRVVLERPWSG